MTDLSQILIYERYIHFVSAKRILKLNVMSLQYRARKECVRLVPEYVLRGKSILFFALKGLIISKLPQKYTF